MSRIALTLAALVAGVTVTTSAPAQAADCKPATVSKSTQLITNKPVGSRTVRVKGKRVTVKQRWATTMLVDVTVRTCDRPGGDVTSYAGLHTHTSTQTKQAKRPRRAVAVRIAVAKGKRAARKAARPANTKRAVRAAKTRAPSSSHPTVGSQAYLARARAEAVRLVNVERARVRVRVNARRVTGPQGDADVWARHLSVHYRSAQAAGTVHRSQERRHGAWAKAGCERPMVAEIATRVQASTDSSPESAGKALIDSWMGSPPHRAAMLDRSYSLTTLGLGYWADERRIAGVMDFAQPCKGVK